MSTIQPGDYVDHRFDRGLDYRTVTRVEGESLYLEGFAAELGPFPTFNYEVIKKA